MGSAHFRTRNKEYRVEGLAEKKLREVALALDTTMQNAAIKLICSISDEVVENIKKFRAQFDAETDKEIMEVYNGTLKDLDKKRANKWSKNGK